ncbi:MAG: phosphatidylserine/phosphatidylglycerophosphate/cardiolipin synthase family protein [Planctomycetes bacterium]|nr:phosphatidylserine/phosphatidylglycerophosphate/cardiolipin synthase family protein [Planctomycetota bacterium]
MSAGSDQLSVPRAPRGVRDVFRRRLGRRIRNAFTVAEGNSIEPLGPGSAFFTRMASAIDAACVAVDVEMYLWHDDEVGHLFGDALVNAVRRGVRVRLLVDAQGARDAMGLVNDVGAAGADVRVFNPFRLRVWSRYIHRTHKKIVVVDGCVAYTGGAGFSLHFSGSKGGEHPWHDRMYEIRGPVVAHLEAAFEADFWRWDPRCAPCDGPDVTIPVPQAPLQLGGSQIRLLRGWPDARDFRPVLLEAIRAASVRIWIGTPYFLPPHSVRKALYQAAARGVDVRVIHPSLSHANSILYHAVRARYGRYLRLRVQLHEYESAFYHAKTLVVDRTLAVVGSSNFDSWSWKRNAEIDLAITDAPTVDRIAALLDADWASSRPITSEDARIRSFIASLRQRFSESIEDWL